MDIQHPETLATFAPTNAPLWALLAETVELELCTRICHWQVVGPQFRSLHGLFDDQAGELAEMADAVAERTQALGLIRSMTPADLLAGTSGPLPGEADSMLTGLLQAHRARSVRGVRVAAEAADDIVTVSLTESWLAASECRIWMLRASRSWAGS